ncbi:hypothetical protein G647_10156 [Cladophialophora carrionii CBS 160.54]|uniref:AB hydrolase-1 domain-containing protein n=1 Tax=Cladophialophora carrionii CBS 160.54 TaxID=1279043 RepID=V9DM74_9EURO|nr:uncharacterized protein G647_10156 [Cladophialophora carrionii CBS 160.54]ETI27057.1 hypothetical protein G647_10156 [Cladophialophora carrionii CBS 160.54]
MAESAAASAAKPTVIIVHGACTALSTSKTSPAPWARTDTESWPRPFPPSTRPLGRSHRTAKPILRPDPNDVILVPHSYGGIPASGAIQDLDPRSWAAAGKSTSMRAIAAITSFILPEGMTHPGDVPAESETYRTAKSNLNVMSMAALVDRCRFSAFEVVPVHFLLAREDQAMKFATQESVVQRITDRGRVVRTEVLDGCSHSPFLSRVAETVAIVRRSAGEDI